MKRAAHPGGHPARARPHLPRHDRQHDAVHRPVRHRVGHHDRLHGAVAPRTSSSIQAVAPGIAEALIATAIGLAAAIPAVVVYNHFARQIRVLSAEMDNFVVRVPQHRRASLPQVGRPMAFDQAASGGGDAISQINVTPLVDVMLVLLVIFMVTAPILQQGVTIDLPKVQAAAARRRRGAAGGERHQDGAGLPERHADVARPSSPTSCARSRPPGPTASSTSAPTRPCPTAR